MTGERDEPTGDTVTVSAIPTSDSVPARPRAHGRTRPAAAVRIAYCVDTMRVGGSELNALRTAERIDRSRFEIQLVSLEGEGPLAERYRAAGIPIHHFPLTSLYSPSTVRQGLRLARWLRRERIDVLHCHDLYANLFGAPWGRLAGVQVITSRRWIHPLRNRVLEVANRLVYRVGHRVLANSPAVAAALRAVDGVSSRRILLVSNFVDEGSFTAVPTEVVGAFRSELGIPADAQVVGCIARLAAVKDHATLLRAISLLRDRWSRLHLVLVGDGELRGDLEDLTAELGIADRVHFAGFRPNEPNLHHLFDVSVLASLSEGFPNTLVEAMAAQRPVVATRAGGNVDAVRPETGVLVPIGDPSQMAQAIERLLADPELRSRMGAAAGIVARREYHAEAVIAHLERIYLELAGRTA